MPVLSVPPDADDVPEGRQHELQRWIREYEQWKAWFVRWHNRPEPGWFSLARQRRQAPEPPPWLPNACAALVEDTGPLAEGCSAWREWRRGALALLRLEQAAQTHVDRESPRKSTWWQHIHLDGLWPTAQSGSSAFGVFGFHATLSVTRRVQIFLGPGAILMRVPTGDGGHTWATATDWGFSYRIVDFKIPATGRPGTVHLNLARVWILGAREPPLPGARYLAGFSLTFNRASQP